MERALPMRRVTPFSGPLETHSTIFDSPLVLRAMIMNAGVVKVRGWFGTEEEFVELGCRLGALERASPKDSRHLGRLFRVKSRPGDSVGVGRYWHADGFAGTSAPALITIYHVVKGTSSVSNTSFVDGYAAWSNLNNPLRALICDRWWAHASGSRHRFVVDHHKHQCPTISVNLGKISSIQGMNGVAVKRTVSRIATALDLEPRYVHRWTPGDVLLVDNRRMLHRGPDKVDRERILWRTSVIKYSI